MKVKKTKFFAASIITVWLIISGLLVLVNSQVAFAKTTAEKAADEYCTTQYPGEGKTGKKYKACVFGYKKGYKKSKGGDCFNYPASHRDKASEIYKACAKGKTEGKNQRAKDDRPEAAAPTEHGGNADCAGVTTYFDLGCGSSNTKKGGKDNPIVALLLTALSWISGLVALATVGGIVYGGILYTSAQDNASQTQKGITYVVNSVIGLILWFSAYALINFIVPGGLFSP